MKYFLVFSLMFLISSCQSTPEITKAGRAIIHSYTAQEIEIRRAPDFNPGKGIYGNEERAFLAQQFEEILRDRMAEEMKYSLVGKKPAKVVVELQAVSVATSAGRQLNSENSFVKSNVSVIDLETNRIVASSFVGARDEAARNGTVVQGVPVGAIASFIENRNAGAASSRLRMISDSYLLELRKFFKG